MHCSFVFGDLWLWNAYWQFVSEHFWFYRFWTLSLQLEHQESEFSDCDEHIRIVNQKNANQNFLIVIRIFWLWSEFSDCVQNFLIMIRNFWLWSDFSDCDQNFLIVIRIFWLCDQNFLIVWSEFSDCDQNFLIVWSEFSDIVIRIFWLWCKKNANHNFLITIRKFWLWSENSLNKRCFPQFCLFFMQNWEKKRLIEWIFWSQSKFSDCDQIERKKTLIEWIFWSQSEFSDCDQIEEKKNVYWVNFLITIRIFWLWSEFSDCDQIEKKTHAYWEINKTERPKTTNKDLKLFFSSTDPPVT